MGNKYNNEVEIRGKLSIEHVLPQEWQAHWPLARENDEASERRNRALQTFGNLTLVTPEFNTRLSNRKFTINGSIGSIAKPSNRACGSCWMRCCHIAIERCRKSDRWCGWLRETSRRPTVRLSLSTDEHLPNHLKGSEGDWVNEDCNRDYPCGRYLAAMSDRERLALAQTPESLASFARDALVPILSLGDAVDAALRATQGR